VKASLFHGFPCLGIGIGGTEGREVEYEAPLIRYSGKERDYWRGSHVPRTRGENVDSIDEFNSDRRGSIWQRAKASKRLYRERAARDCSQHRGRAAGPKIAPSIVRESRQVASRNA
jgi:hypothetical protein